MMFLIAMLLALWVWLRAEEREGVRLDAQLDREEARKAKLRGPAEPQALPPPTD
jgi:hypothetical protein